MIVCKHISKIFTTHTKFRDGLCVSVFFSGKAYTVYKNVEMPLLIADVPKKERKKLVQASLEKVGLLHKERELARNLSGGEQQRVSIARALVNFFRVNANNTRNQIWIAGSSSIYKKYKTIYLKEQACTASFPQLTDLEKELEKFGKGNFWDNGEREEYEFIEKMKQIIEKVIYIIVLIVIVAVLLNLINNIYTDMQESAAFYGMLRAVGICPEKVYLLVIIREWLMIILTFLFSVFLVWIGVRGIDFLMKEIFFMKIEIIAQDYIYSILSIFCSVSFIISIITYLCYYKLLKNKIANNLKA